LKTFLNERVLFGQLSGFKQFNEFEAIIEGTFYAGSRKALRDFYQHQFAVHDERLAKGIHIGNDQHVMNLLAFRYFNSTVVRLQAFNLGCQFNYDVWFFYQLFFSPNPDHHCTQDRLTFVINSTDIELKKVK
jgi:hypothetical protein